MLTHTSVKVYAREVQVCKEHDLWADVTMQGDRHGRQKFQYKCCPQMPEAEEEGVKRQKEPDHWFVSGFLEDIDCAGQGTAIF